MKKNRKHLKLRIFVLLCSFTFIFLALYDCSKDAYKEWLEITEDRREKCNMFLEIESCWSISENNHNYFWKWFSKKTWKKMECVVSKKDTSFQLCNEI
jgi:hypothetical protein